MEISSGVISILTVVEAVTYSSRGYSLRREVSQGHRPGQHLYQIDRHTD